ncbi:MAG: proline racemase family protein [Terriglobales bacterium]
MNASTAITAIDLHACGEPGRVITGGARDVPGTTMYEKMLYLRDHADGLRKRMLREPRGYPAANCNLILPPTIPGADAGFVIMEQVEYPPMSGSNTICVATALAETGMVPVCEGLNQLKLEAPAGLIEVEVEMRAGKAVRVTFANVPAFAVHLGVRLEVRTLGTVSVDIAWGGMFYVIADAEALGLALDPGNARELVRVGEMIKAAAQDQYPVRHPENADITGPTIAELSAPARRAGVDRRNTVIVSTGKLDWERPETWTGTLDRSPCGTGTCAKMATLYARGQLGLGQDFVHEGILGTTFTGRLLRETTVGPYKAAVPTISGQAWITGTAEYLLDPSDPFPEGYTVGDLWGGQE